MKPWIVSLYYAVMTMLGVFIVYAGWSVLIAVYGLEYAVAIVGAFCALVICIRFVMLVLSFTEREGK